jgi:hypothetical protein
MAMNENDLDQPAYATELAKALDEVEVEITLSVTDAKLAATALRHYADWLEANT